MFVCFCLCGWQIYFMVQWTLVRQKLTIWADRSRKKVWITEKVELFLSQVNLEYIFGMSQAYLRYFSDISKAYIRVISCTPQSYLKHFRVFPRLISFISWPHLWNIIEILQAYLVFLSGISRTPLRYILGTSFRNIFGISKHLFP